MAATQILRRVMPKRRAVSTEPLLSALSKLHVVPFLPLSVRDYKRKKLMEVAQTKPPSVVKYARRANGWLHSMLTFKKSQLQKPQFLGLEQIIGLSVCAHWTNPYGSPSAGTARIRRSFEWNRVTLMEYEFHGGELPVGVGKTVAQITKAVPDAEFSVDTLRSGEDEVFDPFLVVKRGDEEFTIAVWDETYKP